MSRVHIVSIAKYAVALSLPIAIIFVAPLLRNALTAKSPPMPPAFQMHEMNLARLDVETQLVARGVDPLSWSCQINSPDQLRFKNSLCMSAWLVDINLGAPGQRGLVHLESTGVADFLDASGKPLSGQQELSAQQSDAIRALLPGQLATLEPFIEGGIGPPVDEYVEACIGGKSILLTRGYEGAELAAFAWEISGAAGIRLRFNSQNVCH